jgi:hypothetical protein
VSPFDGVNGVRRNLLARIGLSVGCRVSGREDAAVALRSPFQPITRPWQFEGLSVEYGLSDGFAPAAGVRRSWHRPS